MYRTPVGDRILSPAEARLFAESLRTLGDYLYDMELTMGASVFDDLQRNQQIAVLHTIARALLCQDEPAPTLTAAIEAGVWCVYQNIRDMIEVELDDAAGLMPGATWRQLILAACREAEVAEELPEENCRDKREWDFPIEVLESRVLWDYDWQLARFHRLGSGRRPAAEGSTGHRRRLLRGRAAGPAGCRSRTPVAGDEPIGGRRASALICRDSVRRKPAKCGQGVFDRRDPKRHQLPSRTESCQDRFRFVPS